MVLRVGTFNNVTSCFFIIHLQQNQRRSLALSIRTANREKGTQRNGAEVSTVLIMVVNLPRRS